VAVTASFRVLYIFVIIEHASRRLLHWNVTPNPTAAWTLQQLREAIASDQTLNAGLAFCVAKRCKEPVSSMSNNYANQLTTSSPLTMRKRPPFEWRQGEIKQQGLRDNITDFCK
jgi:hypothetical protein